MIVHKKTQSVVFQAKDPATVLALVPKARIIKYKGAQLVQVHHGFEESLVLQNLGIPVPSPMQFYYDWPGPFQPFKHQLEDAPYITRHSRCFVLNEMGTAKTATCLWAVDYLMNIGKVKKCLVAAPLSCLNRVWADQLFDVLPHRTFEVLHGSREKRFERLAADVDFYIINHDGMKIGDMADRIRSRKDIDCIIIDELSTFRNKTEMLTAMLTAIRPTTRVYGLTGTPFPSSPEDGYHQAKLVNPANVPKYFGQFRSQVCFKASTYKWLPREDGFETAFKALTPCVRRKKSECLSLPAVTYTSREVELTAEQKDHFKKMRNAMKMELAAGHITAVNAADKITKLRQIAAGVIKDPASGEYHTLDYSKRFAVLKEFIEEASGKVIVFAPFTGLLRDLGKKLNAHWPTTMVDGSISGKARDLEVRKFTDDPTLRIFLAHPAVASHGLNLQVADTMVWYCPIHSNDRFSQACERMARPGQTKKMTIALLGATAIEWKIYEDLKGQQDVQSRILNIYEAFAKGEL